MAGAGNPLAGKALQWKQVTASIKRQRALDTRAAERQGSAAAAARSPLAAGTANRDPLLLVDASAYIFRAYYAMPPLHRRDGTPTGAVLGVCSMVNRLVLGRLIRGERPRLVLVFDAKGPKFRTDIYPE